METDNYSCTDCDWSGFTSECDFDYEYDEFWGRDVKYLVCPECGGGVEC